MVDFIQKEQYGFEDLCRLVSFLRSENGCDWDKVQTHTSIRRNFLEEAYEACEGLDRDDAAMMREEFGDVLLQVVFHADIERERGRFTISDVCDAICKKLIFRHPHLFGGERQDWETLKKREKGAKTQSDLMDGVARSLPALIRAEKLHEKAKSPAQDVGAALAEFERCKSEDTLGELLLAIVGEAERSKLDSETALHTACERFIARVAASETVDTPLREKE